MEHEWTDSRVSRMSMFDDKILTLSNTFFWIAGNWLIEEYHDHVARSLFSHVV